MIRRYFFHIVHSWDLVRQILLRELKREVENRERVHEFFLNYFLSIKRLQIRSNIGASFALSNKIDPVSFTFYVRAEWKPRYQSRSRGSSFLKWEKVDCDQRALTCIRDDKVFPMRRELLRFERKCFLRVTVGRQFWPDSRKSSSRLRTVYTVVNQLIASLLLSPSPFLSRARFLLVFSDEELLRRGVIGRMRSPHRYWPNISPFHRINRFYSVYDDVGIQLRKPDFVLNNCRSMSAVGLGAASVNF